MKTISGLSLYLLEEVLLISAFFSECSWWYLRLRTVEKSVIYFLIMITCPLQQWQTNGSYSDGFYWGVNCGSNCMLVSVYVMTSSRHGVYVDHVIYEPYIHEPTQLVCIFVNEGEEHVYTHLLYFFLTSRPCTTTKSVRQTTWESPFPRILFPDFSCRRVFLGNSSVTLLLYYVALSIVYYVPPPTLLLLHGLCQKSFLTWFSIARVSNSLISLMVIKFVSTLVKIHTV